MGNKARISLALLMGSVISVSAQPPNLSFKVGGPITSAQILLKERITGDRSITPILGVGYFSLSFKDEYKEEDYPEDNRSFQINVRLLMPKVGARLKVAEVGALRSYGSLEGWMLLPFVSGEEDGKEIDDDFKEDLRDLLGLLGLTVGYGAEYFFSPQFSLGGEASMNWVFWDIDYSDEYSSSKVSAILGATLARVTLNFYFR